MDLTQVKFKVIDNWKGNESKIINLSTGLRRTDTIRTNHSSCDYSFSSDIDNKCLVFGYKTVYGDFQTYSCSMTRTFKNAKGIISVLDKLRKVKDIK